MNTYFVIKTIHIISATILFGTGIGIAFFMLRSLFSNNLQEKLYAAKNTVLADFVFTLPAVIIQPISGVVLIHMSGVDAHAKWLTITYVIYAIAGLCWLPVVWIQMQLKKIVAQSVEKNVVLPARYYKLFAIWILLGIPAFLGLTVVFYLMVAKPT